MKKIVILLVSVIFLLSSELFAQLRPAQSQYFQEKGALVNPSFEQGYKGWSITGTCTKSLESDIPYLNKTLKLTCINQQFSVKQNTTELTGFVNQQALLTAQVKANIGGAFIRTLNNDVEASSASIIAGDYKAINIPDKIASTSNGVEIHTNGVNVTGEFFIDEVGYRLAPDLIQQVGQAQFVGKAFFKDNDCNWERSATTFGGLVTPTLGTCEATEVIGNIEVPSPANNPFITIPNFRTDGYYKVRFQGLLFNDANVNQCIFDLTKVTGTESNNGIIYTTALESRSVSYIDGVFRFEQGDTGNISIQAKNFNGNECSVRGQVNLPSAWTVHFYPDSNSTIVSQQTELTAKTANEFVFKMGSTGTVSSENYDIINGNCSNDATGVYTCNFNSGILSESPVITCTGINSSSTSARICEVDSITSSSFRVLMESTSAGGFSRINTDAEIFVTKTGADVNKSQTIIGKFEAIEQVTADLTAETANELSANLATSGVVNNENYDFINGNCTNPATGRFVCTFNSGIFNETPSCNCTVSRTGASTANLSCHNALLNSSSVEFNVSNNGTASNLPIDIQCSKQGTDVNKSFTGAVINASQSAQTIADIVREDIISTDLCQVEASGGSTSPTTNSPIPFTEVSDNCNAYNGAEFTAQKSGKIVFSGTFTYTTARNGTVLLYKNGVQFKNGFAGQDSVTTTFPFTFIDNAEVGDVYFITFNNAGTLVTSTSGRHLSITELPDTASIVENLNQNPRVSLQDQYSETEIEWGLWNGQQLYRRCFTVASDITTNTTIATWDTGLQPKGDISVSGDVYILDSFTINGSGTAWAYIQYNKSNGQIDAVVNTYTIDTETSHCMDYTK